MVERCEERGQAADYFQSQPSSKWVQDACNNTLTIQLPGFKKEDIKVIVDSTGRLTVMGTKRESASFEKSYRIPPGSNIDKITGKFENDCLILIIPKSAAVPEKREGSRLPEKRKEAAAQKQSEAKKSDELTMEERESRERRIVPQVRGDDWMVDSSVMDIVDRNRKLIGVALMAFAVGFYVSSKLRTSSG